MQLPILLDLPEPLKLLLSDETAEARHFQKNIGRNNSALTMASMEANVDLRVASGPMAGGPHQFRIFGTIYRRMGPLVPKNNEKTRFAQVYVAETEDQLRAWHGLAFAQSLREPLLIGLGNMSKEHNAYAKAFRQAAPLHDPDVIIMLRCASNVDPRTYNVPWISEVAAFIPAGTNVNAPRQIFVHLQTGGVMRITDLNSAYDPLHYVLFVPRGEQGWTTDI